MNIPLKILMKKI